MSYLGAARKRRAHVQEALAPQPSRRMGFRLVRGCRRRPSSHSVELTEAVAQVRGLDRRQSKLSRRISTSPRHWRILAGWTRRARRSGRALRPAQISRFSASALPAFRAAIRPTSPGVIASSKACARRACPRMTRPPRRRGEACASGGGADPTLVGGRFRLRFWPAARKSGNDSLLWKIQDGSMSSRDMRSHRRKIREVKPS